MNSPAIPPPGYHGRYLRVDLRQGHGQSIAIPSGVLRRCIGGVGLGAWILLKECPPGIDPTDESAPLIFAFSPLVGSPLTTSAKFAVVAKSPLTNRITDALSSSSFAIAGKKTGFDAIVIVGRVRQLSCLVIDDTQASEDRISTSDDRTASGNVAVEVKSCPDLAGMSSREVEAALRQQLGNSFRCASIGLAGENLVRYATISNEGRHAGRGGLGCVMGAKNLKAVVVRGNHAVEFAQPNELNAYAKELSKRSFGPETAKYRELGTVSNLLTLNRLGTLPTRNFQQSEFESAEAISPEAMSETLTRTRGSCAACTIGCEHIFTPQTGSENESRPVRMEYENLFALGSLCGISDPNAVVRLSGLCDEFGLDTISTGGTVAFAMECVERGLLDEPWLQFGDSHALEQAINQIVQRKGIGDLLAEGSRQAALRIGNQSIEFAPQVKGLEMPGYEPRAMQTMALGYAVGTRGADHNRSGGYQVDLSSQVNRMNISDDAVRMAIETENEAAVMDSMILCKFLRGVFDDRFQHMAKMLQLVTGFDYSPSELRAIANDIVTLKKSFNQREGWTPGEDRLPSRFFSESISKGTSMGATLSFDRLAELIKLYNTERGWSEDGFVGTVRFNDDSC